MKSITLIRSGGLAVIAVLSASLWVTSGLLGAEGAQAGGGGIAGVSERPNLQICVAQPDGSKPGPEVMAKLRQALSDVKEHPEFKPAGLDANGGPKLVAGCPSASTLGSKDQGGRKVSRPGPVHTYVFLTSDEELRGSVFKRDRVGVQERICDEERCASVSNALYVTQETLADQRQLSRALAVGIGLPVDKAPAADGGAAMAAEKAAE